MKTIKFGLASFVAAATDFYTFTRNKTKKIKIAGHCPRCKKHIEMAAKSLAGVKKAIWDKKTKVLTVRFNSSKINLKDIELAIAKEGHNTESFKAKNEFYAELPKCCKYFRDVTKKDNMRIFQLNQKENT